MRWGQDSSPQVSDVRPRSGNQCTNEPPARSTTSRIAKRKPGIAYPTITTALVQTSNGVPSRTALATPRGIEIR